MCRSAVTAFVALRVAFSTVHDSLGAQPEAQLVENLPEAVADAVPVGRTMSSE
jgi:hypothetical protein